MKRKDFVRRAVLIAVGTPLILMSNSCSKDDADASPIAKDCLANGTKASVGSNHGHTLVVPKSDVENGTDRTYSIQGSSSHNHLVTITANQFSILKDNNSFNVVSSSDVGHTHFVTVSCA